MSADQAKKPDQGGTCVRAKALDRSRAPHAVRTAAAFATALLLAGAGVGVAGADAASAAWRSSTLSAPAALRAATFSSAFYPTGTTTSPSQTYRLSGLVEGTTAYIDLVNTSSTNAQLTFSFALTSLVAGNTVRGCSRPWTGTGTCPDTPAGTGTAIADSTLLTNGNGTYATPTAIASAARLYLQVSARGVAASITLTATAPIKRPAQDRTRG